MRVARFNQTQANGFSMKAVQNSMQDSELARKMRATRINHLGSHGNVAGAAVGITNPISGAGASISQRP